jgi:hypothetical protein
MKVRSIFLTFALIITICDLSNAQGGILRRAINRQIDNKIDSAIDKSAQEKAKESSQENTGTKATGRGLLGGKIDIKYEDEYKFTGRLYMQMETYDKKDVMKSILYLLQQNTLNAGIEVCLLELRRAMKQYSCIYI